MLLVNRIRDIINKIIPVLTITQKVIGILLMVISFCLLFPLLQEKYSYNDMTTSIIYIFFFIALLIYSIITIFKVVIFLAFKINSLRSVFLIPYCILILLFVFFCYTINSPYNHPSSVDSYKIRTVISTIGFEEYEINDIHLYEFKKDTDFSSLVHEIPLTEFRVRERFYGYESSDSLSVMFDWLITVNDTIVYRITEQKTEKRLVGKMWENCITSYVLNGEQYSNCGIYIEKNKGKIKNRDMFNTIVR